MQTGRSKKNRMEPLEFFWDNLLSRSPERILAIFKTVDEESQQIVISHLRKMASETGWHPEQVISAQAALDVLADIFPEVKQEK